MLLRRKLTRKQALNDTLEQFDLIDIYRTLHTQNDGFHLLIIRMVTVTQNNLDGFHKHNI